MDQIKAITMPTMPLLDGAAASQATAGARASGFMNSLQQAISKTNDLQLEASQATEALMTGQTQNIHQTMVALQEADVSFQLMMQIRNKLVTAYEEIQRIQI